LLSPEEREEILETKIEDAVPTEINKIGFVNRVITVILHLEQNAIDVENQDLEAEMEVNEEIEMVIAAINDLDVMTGGTAAVMVTEAILDLDVMTGGTAAVMVTEVILDLDAMTEGIVAVMVTEATLDLDVMTEETVVVMVTEGVNVTIEEEETETIEGLEEINLKTKVEMGIGNAKVAGTIISHLELNVIDVESRKQVAVLDPRLKEGKITDGKTEDQIEGQAIEEIGDKIREVVVQITVEIQEEVVVQTTSETVIDVDLTHKVMNRMLHPRKEGRENVQWEIRR